MSCRDARFCRHTFLVDGSLRMSVTGLKPLYYVATYKRIRPRKGELSYKKIWPPGKNKLYSRQGDAKTRRSAPEAPPETLFEWWLGHGTNFRNIFFFAKVF